ERGHGRTRGEDDRVPCFQVGGDDVDGDRCILEPFVRDVSPEQGAQAGVGDYVIGPPKQSQRSSPWVEWKDVLAAQSTPDAGELPGSLAVRMAGHPGGVDGARGGPDQQVGSDALIEQRLQHSDLYGAEAATPGQDKGDAAGRGRVRPHFRKSYQANRFQTGHAVHAWPEAIPASPERRHDPTSANRPRIAIPGRKETRVETEDQGPSLLFS